jgi:hypothetical protein
VIQRRKILTLALKRVFNRPTSVNTLSLKSISSLMVLMFHRRIQKQALLDRKGHHLDSKSKILQESYNKHQIKEMNIKE